MRITFATGETVLASHEKRDDVIGHLVFNGESYPLSEGTNTVGRHSKQSQATVQLPTDDQTMSRLHIQIQVTRLKNGRIKPVISDLRDAEKIQFMPTLVDDVPLLPEDAMVLTNGDIITLGKTRIKYVK